MRADMSTAKAPGRSCPLHYRYDAHRSYFERIRRGPDFTPAQAMRDDIVIKE